MCIRDRYTLFGSVLMLIALLALYFACGETFDMQLMMERAPFALDGVVWWGMSAIKIIWVLLLTILLAKLRL